MNKKVKLLFLMLGVFIILQGCSGKADSKDKVLESNATEPTSTAVVSEEAVPTVETTPTAEPTVTPVPLVLPVTQNDTGKVLIQTVSWSPTYKYNSYIISSINGENIVIDPTAMPKKTIVDINPAAITSTHPHPDHIDEIFTSAYDCKKLLYIKDDIQTEDFHIYSMLSSHSNDTIIDANKNVIIVYEVDGLRIAHMGDVGQTSLTEEQLEELGVIDIAFMQFENSYSGMSLANGKGFTLIEQLNPKIIIPTHYTPNALPIFTDKYGEITYCENTLEISKEDLPEDTMNVYIISNKHKYTN